MRTDPEVVIMSIPTASHRGLVALSMLAQESGALLRIERFAFQVEAVLTASIPDRCFVLLTNPIAKVMAELPGPSPAAPAGNALHQRKRRRRRRNRTSVRVHEGSPRAESPA
jgi:hypothetical protein